MNLLPPEQAVTLLETRLGLVTTHFHQLDEISAEIRGSHLAFEYMHRFYAEEVEWLTKVIRRLQSTD